MGDSFPDPYDSGRKSAIHLGHSVSGEKPGGPCPSPPNSTGVTSRPQRHAALLVLALPPTQSWPPTQRIGAVELRLQPKRRGRRRPCLSCGVTLRPRLSGCEFPSAQRSGGCVTQCPGAQLGNELNEVVARSAVTLAVSCTMSPDPSARTAKR